MKDLLASSGNSNDLSLTIKGALIGIVPIIIGVFKLLGIELTETVVVDLIQNGTALLSAFIMLFGSIRKVWNIVRG